MRVDVQHERVDVAAQRGDDERHPLRHQAEMKATSRLRHGNMNDVDPPAWIADVLARIAAPPVSGSITPPGSGATK